MTFILVRGIGQAFVTSEVPADPVAAVLADAIAA
jgi:3-dehydroquinate synthase